MKKIIISFLLINSLLLIAQGKELRTFPDLQNKLDIRFPIEHFKNMKGQNYSPEYLKGKPTFINFWSTTCAPCLKEIPILNKLKESLGDKVNFIGITYDNKEKVDKFLQTHSYSFQQITDAGPQLKTFFVIQRYPVSFIIDKNGNTKEIIGIIDEQKLSLIEKLLSQ